LARFGRWAFAAAVLSVALGGTAHGQQRPPVRRTPQRSQQPPAQQPPTQSAPPPQRVAPPPSLIARADSAFANDDRGTARRLYMEALARDSSLSRAVFRLAQLADTPREQLALYTRYVAMQPRDAWGFMAQGDALGRLAQYDEALAAYDHAAAIAPDERDVAIGRARLHQRAGRPGDAATELTRWTARHANDADAWDLLGRAALRSGRPQQAERAFGRAEQLGGVQGAGERRAWARALAAPAVEPLGGYQRDSDGNRAARIGAFADVMIADGTRLGAGAEHLTIGDGTVSSSGEAAYGRLSSRPSPGTRLDVQAGAVRLAAPGGAGVGAGAGSVGGAGAAWTTPQFDGRLRLRAPRNGPSLELRAQRLALGTAPILVTNRVARTEGRATLDLPAGWFRLRGTGRYGAMSASGEASNARYGADGALVLPLGAQLQLSGQYRLMGFQRASAAGYFAPRRAETIESGVYVETSGEGALSFAADVGGGAQRVAAQGAKVGAWTRALRFWGYGALAMGPARSLYAEVEAYDAPFAPEGVATSGTWRFASMSVGVRWGLR